MQPGNGRSSWEDLGILVTGPFLDTHNVKWSLKKAQPGFNLKSEVSACTDAVRLHPDGLRAPSPFAVG